MLTAILKRNVDPIELQLTQRVVMNELWNIKGSEMLVTDSWREGLKNVRTPFVCLLEGDCLLSPNYFVSGMEQIIHVGQNKTKGTGGLLRLAMISPSIGVNSWDDIIWGYQVEGNEVYPSTSPTQQIGSVPGAIIRYSSIKEDLDNLAWDEPNIVKLSATISTHFWNTDRIVRFNPEAVYVSTNSMLTTPTLVSLTDKVREVFRREII